MTERVQVGGIQVAKNLYDFVNNEAIPGTGVDADKFWAAFDKIVNELAPRNRELLVKRDAIQEKWTAGTVTTKVRSWTWPSTSPS